MAGATGLATAVELAGGAGEVPEAEEEQLELLELLGGDAAPLPLPAAALARAGPKGGRPKGARNRSTEAWRELLASRYRSPLIGLAEMWSRTPRQLAEALELYKWHDGKPVLDAQGRHVLDTGAAAAMQQAAMVASLPYWHQRQPLAVEAKGDARGLVVINLGGETAVGDGSDGALSLGLAPASGDTEQNQHVIDVTPSQSDDE